ncbi:hypothetical protein PHMEG_00023537 [Phytophthora megakarya]|uniref:Uncharacterized protein n=1 Tax=Phytophthora megakarya TaxID=4795 RepID=A0A225VGT3_9STRA|nr:hypothetical protein PHMEG_00023537 [Phytophthora megakarya]
MSTLSANARKQKEDDIERLVKCRLRSEIEARKSVESTMKRAVQEARELKKELVLLRQEKEELRLAARKHAVSTPDNGGKDLNQPDKRAVVLKLREKIQTLSARNNELQSSTNELQQQISELEDQKAKVVGQLTADLEEKNARQTPCKMS